MIKKGAFWKNAFLKQKSILPMLRYLNRMSAKGLHVSKLGKFKNTFEKDKNKRYVYAICSVHSEDFYSEVGVWERICDYKGFVFYRKRLPKDCVSIKKRNLHKKAMKEKLWLGQKLKNGLLLFAKVEDEYIFEKSGNTDKTEYYVDYLPPDKDADEYIYEKALCGYECVSPSTDGSTYYFIKREGKDVVRGLKNLKSSGEKLKKRMAISFIVFLLTLAGSVTGIFFATRYGKFVLPSIIALGSLTAVTFLVFIIFLCVYKRRKKQILAEEKRISLLKNTETLSEDRDSEETEKESSEEGERVKSESTAVTEDQFHETGSVTVGTANNTQDLPPFAVHTQSVADGTLAVNTDRLQSGVSDPTSFNATFIQAPITVNAEHTSNGVNAPSSDDPSHIQSGVNVPHSDDPSHIQSDVNPSPSEKTVYTQSYVTDQNSESFDATQLTNKDSVAVSFGTGLGIDIQPQAVSFSGKTEESDEVWQYVDEYDEDLTDETGSHGVTYPGDDQGAINGYNEAEQSQHEHDGQPLLNGQCHTLSNGQGDSPYAMERSEDAGDKNGVTGSTDDTEQYTDTEKSNRAPSAINRTKERFFVYKVISSLFFLAVFTSAAALGTLNCVRWFAFGKKDSPPLLVMSIILIALFPVVLYNGIGACISLFKKKRK